MKHEIKINRVLVVLSPDLIQPNEPQQSTLIQRAVSLAKIIGCELELFHICYDGGLEHQLFESDVDLERQRKELTDRDSTLLAEMAVRLKEEGIKVQCETQWDSSRTEAILRKIVQSQSDVVMKQAREHSYVLGITSNTDWDLARRSPAHVWLVNDNVECIERIMTAIGNNLGDHDDVTTAADHDMMRMAVSLGKTFKAAVYPVNAFQVPAPQVLVPAAVGTLAPAASVDYPGQSRAQIVNQHRNAVTAFAQYFNIPKENVRIREGHPSKVIAEVAESIAIDLIVMGADSISRLERLTSSVTVEPVMAGANTDILIVREPDPADLHSAATSQLMGVPKYDFEKAITNPKATFDSPMAVANLSEISVELCSRILQVWECDIHAQMMEEDEGEPNGDVDANVLEEIVSARAMLKKRLDKPDNGQMLLYGESQ